MATSGSKSVKVTSYDTLKFSWERTSYSVAKNTSTISWKMELIATANGKISSTASKDWSVTVNGTKYSGTNTVGISASSTKTLASGSTTIAHSVDGSKTFSYSFSQEFAITFSGSSIGTKSGSSSGTLTSIPRAASITTASNFNDEGSPSASYSNPAGSAATVQIGLYWDSSTALIAYTTVTGTSGTKTFSLTTAQKNAIYSKLASAKSKTIYYYIKTTIGDYESTSKVAKTVSITNATPTLSPTAVEDTDSSTDGGDAAGNIAATGSNTRWIKGISDIRYTFGAAAKKGASIKSYKVVCGSKSGTSSSGALFDIDSGTVTFTITDSRGNTATKTLTRELVNYVKLTSNLKATAALDTETTAKATINIYGDFFNGKINPNTTNVLELEYRYKVSGGSYGSWASLTPTKSGNKYSLTYTVPASLDYQKSYIFQARARDDLKKAYGEYVYSKEITVKATPVFDWGSADFKFNVPVKMPASLYGGNGALDMNNSDITGCNSIYFADESGAADEGIQFYRDGTNTDSIWANGGNLYFTPNYPASKTSYNIMGAIRAMTQGYELSTTVTKGANYSSASGSAYLIGNTLRCYFSATRNAASGAGNIANETVATFKINHSGKIKGMYSIAFGSGGSGGVASFTTTEASNENNVLTFNVSLAATGSAITDTSTYFNVPVTINLNAY